MTVADLPPLTLRQKLGYGAGDLGASLFFQLALVYLFYFYTDVAVIPPGWVATIFVTTRLIDAFCNLLIGGIADRTRTRWGRFRPYILFGGPPLAVMAFATFSVIGGPLWVKIAYALATYLLFSICFAAVAIPYAALMATMSVESRERSLLSVIRAGFSFSAAVVVAVAVLPLVKWGGGGAGGFHVAVLALTALALPLLFITFSTSEERVKPSTAAKPNLRALAIGLGTRPLLTVTVGFLLSNIAALLRSTAAIYYFKYDLMREDLIPTYLTVGSVMTVVGILCTPLATSRLGKRGTMIAGVLLIASGHLALAVLPRSVPATIVCIGILPFFGLGMKSGTLWSMLADSVDYAEWKVGYRVEGASYGVALFGQKLSFALGGALTGWTLSLVGYRPNVAQTVQTMNGIFSLVATTPGILMLIAVGVAWAYPLTEERMVRIQADLKARAKASPTVDPGSVPVPAEAPAS